MKKKMEARLLDKAATILSATGWCRNVGTDGKGRHCVSFVIRMACDESPDQASKIGSRTGRCLLITDAVVVTDMGGNGAGLDTVEWNDTVCRSAGQAQRMLLEAASLALNGA